jgi:hypothetical protein
MIETELPSDIDGEAEIVYVQEKRRTPFVVRGTITPQQSDDFVVLRFRFVVASQDANPRSGIPYSRPGTVTARGVHAVTVLGLLLGGVEKGCLSSPVTPRT